jgi:hypothetical protein
MRDNDETNFFIGIIFETYQAKENFCEKYKVNSLEQYIKAEDFLKLLSVK